MSTQQWKPVKHESSTRSHELVLQVNYGVLDKKGRVLGHTLVIALDKFNYDTKQLEPCIIAMAYATRNGIPFGAGFPPRYPQESIEAAQAFLLKKAEEFQKTVQRKADKNGGIYP